MVSQEQIKALSKRQDELYKFINILRNKKKQILLQHNRKKMIFGTTLKKHKLYLRN